MFLDQNPGLSYNQFFLLKRSVSKSKRLSLASAVSEVIFKEGVDSLL